MGKGQKRLGYVLLAIVLIVVLFVSLIGFIADFLWFKEMGYLSVFFKKMVTQLTVGIPTFIVVTGLVYIYSEETDLRKLKKTTIVLSAIFGLFATVMTIMELWFEILKFTNSTSFDLNDPLFNMDISFYIFKLDFLSQLNDILIGIIIGFILLTVIYYIILMTVRTPDVFKEEVPPDAESADGEGERYSGSSNPFENGNRRTNDANEFFGKFSEAFTGKKFQARPVKPKKQFDDSNFKQLMQIASGKLAVLG